MCAVGEDVGRECQCVGTAQVHVFVVPLWLLRDFNVLQYHFVGAGWTHKQLMGQSMDVICSRCVSIELEAIVDENWHLSIQCSSASLLPGPFTRALRLSLHRSHRRDQDPVRVPRIDHLKGLLRFVQEAWTGIPDGADEGVLEAASIEVSQQQTACTIRLGNMSE